jgi:hypothetical protein
MVGQSKESQSGVEQQFLNFLPQGCFLIITGILIFIYVGISRQNLMSSDHPSTIAHVSWAMCCLIVGLNFAAGAMALNSFSRNLQIGSSANLNISEFSNSDVNKVNPSNAPTTPP